MGAAEGGSLMISTMLLLLLFLLLWQSATESLEATVVSE
jgi:hypothetical protein